MAKARDRFQRIIINIWQSIKIFMFCLAWNLVSRLILMVEDQVLITIKKEKLGSHDKGVFDNNVW
jgi:hypothetical protein